MKWGRKESGRASVDSALPTSRAIFDVIKRIPGGAVERKIKELGETRVWEHWLGMRLYKIGDPQYRLPPKGVRTHFWKPAIRNEDSVLRLVSKQTLDETL
jgi:hypothetical protein